MSLVAGAVLGRTTLEKQYFYTSLVVGGVFFSEAALRSMRSGQSISVRKKKETAISMNWGGARFADETLVAGVVLVRTSLERRYFYISFVAGDFWKENFGNRTFLHVTSRGRGVRKDTFGQGEILHFACGESGVGEDKGWSVYCGFCGQAQYLRLV